MVSDVVYNHCQQIKKIFSKSDRWFRYEQNVWSFKIKILDALYTHVVALRFILRYPEVVLTAVLYFSAVMTGK